jgi:hypothetical protein
MTNLENLISENIQRTSNLLALTSEEVIQELLKEQERLCKMVVELEQKNNNLKLRTKKLTVLNDELSERVRLLENPTLHNNFCEVNPREVEEVLVAKWKDNSLYLPAADVETTDEVTTSQKLQRVQEKLVEASNEFYHLLEQWVDEAGLHYDYGDIVASKYITDLIRDPYFIREGN